jgi:hypothetical protein
VTWVVPTSPAGGVQAQPSRLIRRPWGVVANIAPDADSS